MELIKPSVCPLDCPDTCSLSVTVREGKVAAVRGSRANPLTGGVICNKVARWMPELVHGPGRLTTPLLRVGPKGSTAAAWQPVSWDTALDAVHERVSTEVAQHGPQCVVPLNYAGPHGALAMGSMDLRFFHRLGASLLHRVALCGGIRKAAYLATFGAVPGSRPEQITDSQLVVAWGNNITWCNLHLMPLINQAKKKGGRLVVVDPRRTKAAQQADLYLPIRPGTDVVLAYAVAQELEQLGAIDRAFCDQHVLGLAAFMLNARQRSLAQAAEICGLPQEDIRTLAQWYAQADPATIAVGNGLERNQNGGSGIRAVFALPALAGQFGKRGGGVVNGAGYAFPATPDKLGCSDFIPPGTRTLNILDIGSHLLDPQLAPPIEVLFIYNHNPLIVHPDQNRLRRGFERDDLFVVGIDTVMTDSLAYADVVLPASTHFEATDIYSAYGQQWLQRADAVIPPVGNSLPNTEIFRRLAARFGFDEPAFRESDEELIAAAFDGNDPRLQGQAPEQLPPERALPMTYEGEEAILFKNVFPATPSGKIEIQSAALAAEGADALPQYRPREAAEPLALISPASDQRITSTFGGLAINQGRPHLEMHPQDAQARALRDGQIVRVWNNLGEVLLTLRITEAVRPGVVCSLKGAWMHTSENGQTISALAPAHHADLSGGACFNDARVEVAPVASADRLSQTITAKG